MDDLDSDSFLGQKEETKLLLAELAQALSELVKEEQSTNWEPFETHTHQLKSQLQADSKLFRRRLMHGYEVLLETLAKDQE